MNNKAVEVDKEEAVSNGPPRASVVAQISRERLYAIMETLIAEDDATVRQAVQEAIDNFDIRGCITEQVAAMLHNHIKDIVRFSLTGMLAYDNPVAQQFRANLKRVIAKSLLQDAEFDQSPSRWQKFWEWLKGRK